MIELVPALVLSGVEAGDRSQITGIISLYPPLCDISYFRVFYSITATVDLFEGLSDIFKMDILER